MIVGAIILVAITLSNAPHRAPACRHAAKEGVHDAGLIDTGCRNAGAARLAGKLAPGPLAWLLLLVVVIVSSASRRRISSPAATFGSVAFQLPELGLLTLAMLMPILSGGINLAVTFTANICGLTLAWVLQGKWRRRGRHLRLPSRLDPGRSASARSAGLVMGSVIAYTGAHPILVSLSMMIFLRGLGEFLTRGGDISGFPSIPGAARPWQRSSAYLSHC